MDEKTKDFIRQTYHKAIATFDAEYLGETLSQAGIDTNDPEIIALLRELDEYYGIYLGISRKI